MWKVLPKFGIIKSLFFVYSVILLSVLTLSYEKILNKPAILNIENLTEAFKFITPVTFVFALLTYITGKWLWRIFWLIPGLKNALNRSVCPDLNGKWVGIVTWKSDDSDSDMKSKSIVMSIKADMFGFAISLKSDDGYSESTVLHGELTKHPQTGQFSISYLFQGEVPNPEPTDVALYDGAAKLAVKYEDSGEMTLSGHYWTNRAWQRGLNTAGCITLSRKN